jgi:hypothetical protein
VTWLLLSPSASFWCDLLKNLFQLRSVLARVAELPVPDDVKALSRRDYQLNSAHNGITMSGDGKKLCVAATMSGYAAIVHRDTFESTIVRVGPKPYWSTTSVCAPASSMVGFAIERSVLLSTRSASELSASRLTRI